MMRYIEKHGAELVTAAGVGLWGLILLNPYSAAFSVFSASLREMEKHATENEWGAFAVFIAATCAFGLIRKVKTIRVIGLSSALAFRVFTLIFIGITTKGVSTGIGDFLLWSLIALYALYRVSNDG